MTTFVRLGALAVMTALCLSGCSTTIDSVSEDMALSMPAMDVAESSAVDMEMGMREESAAVSATEPDVITTGYLSLTVDTPSESATTIENLVVSAGGRIASRSDYTPVDYGTPSSYLEARIPVDVLEPTLTQIKALGTLQEISVNSYDVSLQKVDLDARITVLEAARERLTQLLATAESTSDLISIETALADRQAELDSLQSQRDYLSDQTLFATINFSLTTPEGAITTEPDGFLDGLIRGLESIVAFALGALVWMGILLPWLGIVAVVIAIVMVIRVVRRRKA